MPGPLHDTQNVCTLRKVGTATSTHTNQAKLMFQHFLKFVLRICRFIKQNLLIDEFVVYLTDNVLALLTVARYPSLTLLKF